MRLFFRLCLDDSSPLRSMVDAYHEGQLYINILYSLTNVLIADDDQVSTKICNDCNFKLITSYEFKKQVETVQESLETAEYEIQDPDDMEEIECAIEEIGGEVSVQEFDNDSQLFDEEEETSWTKLQWKKKKKKL